MFNRTSAKLSSFSICDAGWGNEIISASQVRVGAYCLGLRSFRRLRTTFKEGLLNSYNRLLGRFAAQYPLLIFEGELMVSDCVGAPKAEIEEPDRLPPVTRKHNYLVLMGVKQNVFELPRIYLSYLPQRWSYRGNVERRPEVDKKVGLSLSHYSNVPPLETIKSDLIPDRYVSQEWQEGPKMRSESSVCHTGHKYQLTFWIDVYPEIHPEGLVIPNSNNTSDVEKIVFVSSGIVSSLFSYPMWTDLEMDGLWPNRWEILCICERQQTRRYRTQLDRLSCAATASSAPLGPAPESLRSRHRLVPLMEYHRRGPARTYIAGSVFPTPSLLFGTCSDVSSRAARGQDMNRYIEREWAASPAPRVAPPPLLPLHLNPPGIETRDGIYYPLFGVKR
ncbi:hypothetical protein B0H13DRAFT_1899996 [Mycena leptocephala]|nr:hypothetical protein B0H13DRAFT_1899996 [Mycena leptocephala]